jgi:uncharacterized metal-binding protein
MALNVDREDTVCCRIDGVRAETKKAVAVQINGGDAVWLPRSQIVLLEEDKGKVWIPRWLALDKGMRHT